MANYKAATPIDIVSLKGGNYNGETEYYEKRKCMVGSVVIASGNTWLANHGVRYNNTTGLSYSGNRILALDDVEKIPSPTPTPTIDPNYYFDNYIVPDTLFCWASGNHVAKSTDSGDVYSRLINHVSGKTCGGTAVVIGSSISQPLIAYNSVIYPEVSELVVTNYISGVQEDLIHYCEDAGYPTSTYTQGDYTYEVPSLLKIVENEYEYYPIIETKIEEITHEAYREDYLTMTYSQGVLPYYFDINGSTLGNGRTLFGFGSFIIIDFGGENCRDKYFSFIVGSNESMVMTYANQGTDPSSPEASAFGWGRAVYSTYLDGTVEGNPMYGINFLYLKTINYSSGSGETYSEPIEIPPYVSVDSVWAGIRGFEVIFKDTSLTNNAYGERLGKEVFVLGRNIDTDVWDTTGHGIVVVCRNFRMQ